MKNLNILAVMAFVGTCAAPVSADNMASAVPADPTPMAQPVDAKNDAHTKKQDRKAKKEAAKRAREGAQAKKEADAKPIAEAYKAEMAAAAGDKAKEKAAWKKAADELKEKGVVGKRARHKTIAKFLGASEAKK